MSEAASKRASEYALHPVLLDAALHVFSAGARTIEDRRAGMKLPVRFARILFVQSPGASSRVSAEVLQCNEELIEGRIGLYDAAGQAVRPRRWLPCRRDERRAQSGFLRRNPRSGLSRRLGACRRVQVACRDRTGAAQRVGRSGQPRRSTKCSTCAARAASNRSWVPRTTSPPPRSRVGCARWGSISAGATRFSADSLEVADAMRPVFDRLMEKLAKRASCSTVCRRWLEGDTGAEGAASSPSRRCGANFSPRIPGTCPRGCCAPRPEPLSARSCAAKRMPCRSLFGGQNADLLEQFYGDGLFASHWMTGIAAAVKEAASHLPEGPGLADPRSRCGHRWSRGLRAAAARARSPQLHLHRRLRRILLRRPRRSSRRFPRGRIQGARSREGSRRAGLRAWQLRFHRRHQRPPRRGRCPKVTLGHLHELLAPGGTLCVHGRGDAPALDGSDLRPDQRLVASSPTAISVPISRCSPATSGSDCWARSASPRPSRSAGPARAGRGEGQIGLLARKAWQEPAAELHRG